MTKVGLDRRALLRGAGISTSLLAASPVAGLSAISAQQTNAPPPNAGPPIWEGPAPGGYHSFQSLKDDVDALVAANSDHASSFVLGTTHDQLPIMGIRLHADSPPKKRVLFIGGHHACERISVEVTYLLAKYILDSRGLPNRPSSLAEMEIIVVPLLNPDGHVYATSANWNWRKNRSPNGKSFGVDLNRNYSVGFGTGESSNKPALWDYHGPKAFSELETQAVAALFNVPREPIHALITYHCYGQHILYPWGSKKYHGGDARIDGLIDISNTMAAASRSQGFQYSVGPASDFYAETVGGDLCDWALEKHGARGLTVELPPLDDSASPGFKMPSSQIEPAFRGHLPAALAFLEWVRSLRHN